MKKIILSVALLFFAACSNSEIKREYPEDPAIVRKSRGGKFFKDDVTLYGKKDQKKPAEKISEENKNPLWISSVEVISNLLPISVMDSKSGFIVTEWYQDEKNTNERIKINLLVKGDQIKNENLSLSLFRQKKDADGIWHDQPLGDDLSIKLIKEKILDKANNLAKK